MNSRITLLILIVIFFTNSLANKTICENTLWNIKPHWSPTLKSIDMDYPEDLNWDEYLIIFDPRYDGKEGSNVFGSFEKFLGSLNLRGECLVSQNYYIFRYCKVNLTLSKLKKIKKMLPDNTHIILNNEFDADENWKSYCKVETVPAYDKVYKIRALRNFENIEKHTVFDYFDSITKYRIQNCLRNNRDYRYGQSELLEKIGGITPGLCERPLVLVFIVGTGVNNINNQFGKNQISAFLNFTDDITPFEESCSMNGLGTKTASHILNRVHEDNNLILFSIKVVNKNGLTKPSWVLNAINTLITMSVLKGTDNPIVIADFTSIFQKKYLQGFNPVFDSLGRHGITVVTHANSATQAENPCDFYPTALPNTIVVASADRYRRTKISASSCSDIKYSAKVFEEVEFMIGKKLNSNSYMSSNPAAASITAILVQSLKNLNSIDLKNIVSDTEKSKEFLLNAISKFLT